MTKAGPKKLCDTYQAPRDSRELVTTDGRRERGQAKEGFLLGFLGVSDRNTHWVTVSEKLIMWVCVKLCKRLY